MFSRIEQIEFYLAKNIDNLDLIIEQVCLLLPATYFYRPEIDGGEFASMRQRIDELRKKQRFSAYRFDKSIQRTCKELVSKYEASLAQLAVVKRQSLCDELLQESDEMKVACLISLIHQYHLLKYLRTFE